MSEGIEAVCPQSQAGQEWVYLQEEYGGEGTAPSMGKEGTPPRPLPWQEREGSGLCTAGTPFTTETRTHLGTVNRTW